MKATNKRNVTKRNNNVQCTETETETEVRYKQANDDKIITR